MDASFFGGGRGGAGVGIHAFPRGCAGPRVWIAGGRELHLGSLQPLGLYAANSIFVGDYLTTEGQAPDADYQMIKDLGFEVTRNLE